MLTVHYFRSFTELPETHGKLLMQAAEQNFFHAQTWFEFLMHYLYPEGSEFRLYVVSTDTGKPLLVMPMRHTWHDPAVKKARILAAASHVENYSPLCLIFDPAAENRIQILTALFEHLKHTVVGNNPPCFDVLRLWPVEIGSNEAEIVHKALRNAGFWVQTYANSFNRYENTAGISYQDYFTSRSSNTRYNIGRRRRHLEKNGSLEFMLYLDENNLERGIADYIAVSKLSWKSLGSMINEDWLHLIRLAACKRCLRLGILRVNGRPSAAQFWIVSGGIAYCVRLAYDEAYKKQAVGVVLTDFMIAHVLDHDHVTQLDFGYGEDEYKESWMKECRYYEGYMAFNPSTSNGLYYGVKHIAGQPIKRAIKTLFRR